MAKITIHDLLVKVGADLTEFSKSIEQGQKQLATVASDMKAVGTTLSAAITLPLTAMAAASLTTFANFESGMNRVKALTQSTGVEFEQLTSQAEELGRTTQYTATEASEAMSYLAMAGFDANEIMAAMPSTLQLAAAGATDLGSAADITSNILTGYGLAVEDLSRANDVLVKAFTSANVDLSMLGESFKYVGPLAVAVGVQFEEAAATIGLLGNAGIQGSMAGTALRKSISALISPTKQEADLMEKLNLQAMDAEGNFVGFESIVRQLSASGATAAEVMELFGDRAGPSMQKLVDLGADSIKNLREELEQSEGIAKQVAETQLEGLKGTLTKLKSAFEGTLIAIGTALAPVAENLASFLTDITGIITSLAEQFGKLPKPLQTAAIAFTAFVAVIPPFLALSGGMLGMIANLKLLAPAVALIGTKIGAVTGLTSALGGSSGLVTLLGAAGPLAIALGAAIAGWALYKAITKMKELNAELERLEELQIKGVKATEEQAEEIRILEDVLDRHGKTVSMMGLSVEEYIAALRSAVSELDIAGGSVSAFTVTLKGAADAHADAIPPVEDFGKAAGDSADDVKEASYEYQEFSDRLKELSDYGMLAVLKRAEEMQSAQDKLRDQIVDLTLLTEQLAAQGWNLDDAFSEMTSAVSSELNPTLALTASQLESLNVLFDSLGESILTGPVESGRAAEEVMQSLGVTSSKTISETIAGFEQSREVIKQAWEEGLVSAQDYYTTVAKSLVQQIELYQTLGRDTEALEANLKSTNQVLDDMGAGMENVKSSVDATSWSFEQMSSIVTDLSSGIADVILEGKSLGEVLTGIFEEAYTAVLRFAIEGITKELLTSINNATSASQQFGNVLNSLFGIFSSGSGTGTTATTGLTSGLSSLFSGITGIVASVTSMVTDVLGYFQGARMEQDIARIEESTRGNLAQVISIQGTLNQYLPYLNNLAYLSSIDTRVLDILALVEAIRESGLSVIGSVNDLTDAVETSTETSVESATEIADTITTVAEEAEDTAETIADNTSDTATATEATAEAVEDSTDAVTSTITSAADTVATEVEKVAVAIESWESILSSLGYEIDKSGNVVKKTTTGVGVGSTEEISLTDIGEDVDSILTVSLKALDYLRWLPNLDIALSSVVDVLDTLSESIESTTTSDTTSEDTTEETVDAVEDATEDIQETLGGVSGSITGALSDTSDSLTADIEALNDAVKSSVSAASGDLSSSIGSALSAVASVADNSTTTNNTLNVSVTGTDDQKIVDNFITELRRRGVDI